MSSHSTADGLRFAERSSHVRETFDTLVCRRRGPRGRRGGRGTGRPTQCVTALIRVGGQVGVFIKITCRRRRASGCVNRTVDSSHELFHGSCATYSLIPSTDLVVFGRPTSRLCPDVNFLFLLLVLLKTVVGGHARPHRVELPFARHRSADC